MAGPLRLADREVQDNRDRRLTLPQGLSIHVGLNSVDPDQYEGTSASLLSPSQSGSPAAFCSTRTLTRLERCYGRGLPSPPVQF